MRHIQRQPQQPPRPPQPGQPPRPQRPAGPVPTPGVPPQQAGGHDTYGGYDSGYNTGQVYGSPAGGAPGRPGGPGGPSGPDGPGRAPGPAPDWRKRIKVGSIVLVSALLVTSVSTYFWADSKVRREVDLSKVIERPKEGDCTTYLIVGSDSREGMSDEEKKKLHTGSAEGKRTDSMMILAKCSSGNTMISLPRDSDVEIPSFVGSQSGKKFTGTGRRVKLNAAYAEDGPELLVRTVEHNTGLRIDHYAEIGFAGFANIVDALGGVELDIEEGFKDEKSGADFKAGKQTLNGEQSLAFVRTRYAFAESDLQRTKNQQKFLSALANQAATPSTILNPFALYPMLGAGLDTLIVDKDMGLYDMGQMFFAMKGVNGGDGVSMNMPISGQRGGNLVWDKAKVQQLVKQIQNDEKVTVRGN
ncbi:transcriptional regulator [Streptomyces sp. WM6373]|nr:transcriptional regulator [Streptomyces sp. NRRL S-104]KOU30106.1 transcriptional regulator [Streptomyces sp. WM6373]KOU65969.1 transcriptional regulator [Streptomyces sp. IGB124]KOU71826.1 transcriptional regulator [Streptomyces sp. XY66]KOU82922.1 transcriptional regulator [Streptomyces sp. XY58]KOV04401.1 transcriptional regulator [Streptomyces sp. XY37]KOV16201.1 transcriptional regulator [Streptomyces sp. XY413]KOV30722.1 transcriptional regulator [Streptomyces sp. H021]KOV44767.1 t